MNLQTTNPLTWETRRWVACLPVPPDREVTIWFALRTRWLFQQDLCIGLGSDPTPLVRWRLGYDTERVRELLIITSTLIEQNVVFGHDPFHQIPVPPNDQLVWDDPMFFVEIGMQLGSGHATSTVIA